MDKEQEEGKEVRMLREKTADRWKRGGETDLEKNGLLYLEEK